MIAHSAADTGHFIQERKEQLRKWDQGPQAEPTVTKSVEQAPCARTDG